MLNHDQPDDFVLATNEAYSVRDFVNFAFLAADIEIEWNGSGIDEKAICKSSGKVLLDIDPAFFRPSEVDYLLGDYSKANKILGWEPKTNIKSLVDIMVQSDIQSLS
jgi:GDPmannose 4,6-dehydratase